jgi:hypothetical protein
MRLLWFLVSSGLDGKQSNESHLPSACSLLDRYGEIPQVRHNFCHLEFPGNKEFNREYLKNGGWWRTSRFCLLLTGSEARDSKAGSIASKTKRLGVSSSIRPKDLKSQVRN